MFILAPTTAVAGADDVCGSLGFVVSIVKFILNIIQWVVPIILIILGTIDLVKAVTAGKEDDIKKGQKTLIKRAIAAVIIFLIPLLVGTLMGMIGSEGWKGCWNSASTNIKGFFGTGVGGN